MSNNSSNSNKQHWRKREMDYERLQEWRKKRLQEQLQKQQQTEHQDQSNDFHPNSSNSHVEIMEKLNSIGEQTENLQKEQEQQHNVVQNRISELQRQLVRIERNTASGEESRISIFPPIVIKQEKLEDANTTIITL